jgi:hypothetical protein
MLSMLLFFLVVPSAVAAQPVVAPDNSAATQYTEAYPAPGGEQEAVPGASHQPPTEILGRGPARRLEAAGPDGRSAAALAAATAPNPVLVEDRADSNVNGRGALSTGAPESNSSGFGQIVRAASGTANGPGGNPLTSLMILVAIGGSLFYFWTRKSPAQ